MVDKQPVIVEKVTEKAKEPDLTPEQIKEIMSAPPEGLENMGVQPEEDPDFKDAERIVETKEPVKEPEKKAEEPAKEPAKEPDLKKVEEDLARPDGIRIDFTGYTKNEQALYWQMKRDRRAKQKAEDDRDISRLARLKDQVKEPPVKKEEPIVEDPFKDRDPDDFLTVAEARKLLNKPKAVDEPRPPSIDLATQIAMKRQLKSDEKEARKVYDDYDEVDACAEEIIAKNPEYGQKMWFALMNGENPALVMYDLVKSDPDYDKVLPIAQARIGKKPADKKEEVKEEIKPPVVEDPEAKKKQEEARKAQEALAKNQDKPKTTGNLGAGSESFSSELSADDLLRMSDKEFAKIPKAKRDLILKKYGV